MLTLTDVAVRSENEVYIAAIVDEYSDTNPDHGVVLRGNGAGFKQRLLDHAVASIAVSPEAGGEVCFLGTGATSTFVGATGLWTETLDASDEGPSSRVLMRDALWRHGQLLAFGMARMAYQRDARDRWRRIDSGVFVPREARTSAVGFHAAAASTSGAILLVGQYGEIWSYASGVWRPSESPTNVALVDVLGCGDGRALACGMAGTLLIQSGGEWRAADSGIADDLWSLCEFRGEFYASSTSAVYHIDAHGGLSAVLSGVSAAKLASGFGQLWSVGSKAAFVSQDGLQWSAVDLPTGGP